MRADDNYSQIDKGPDVDSRFWLVVYVLGCLVFWGIIILMLWGGGVV